jgi:DNA-binding NarL/FixJ family response regulator
VGWLGRRRQKKYDDWQRRTFGRVLVRTPEEVAEKLKGTEFSHQISIKDETHLARRIGELSERERNVLILTVEGQDVPSTASYLFLDRQTVKRDLARIVEHLRA